MRYFSAFVLVGLFGCSSTDQPEDQPDAAVPADAQAAADASAPDAEPDDATVDPPDAGGEDASNEDAGATGPTFTGDVFPIIEGNTCSRVGCHGSIRAQGGLAAYLPDPYSAYFDLYERPSIREAKLLVQPGDPEASVLYTHGRDANIPAGDLTKEQLAVIGAWIEAGALLGPDVELPVPPQPATCSVAEIPGTPPLPEACLPRCTRATWDEVIRCRTEPDVLTCQETAIAADTSTVIDLDFGPELGTLPINCNDCLNVQTESCFMKLCQAEYLAFARCQFLDPRPTACNAEANAVSTCANEDADFRPCRLEREALCVAN